MFLLLSRNVGDILLSFWVKNLTYFNMEDYKSLEKILYLILGLNFSMEAYFTANKSTKIQNALSE